MNMEHWCRITISVILILISSAPIYSQSLYKADYIWLFGGPSDSQLLKVDFNEQPGVFQLRSEGLDFGTNNTSISDENGELLFYSNGCAIADRNHQIMPYGDSINEGIFFDLFWLGDCQYGYPGRQDILTISDPANTKGYYIIHKTREYDPNQDPELFMKFLKYSYVDMNLNSGYGDVTIKNEIFFEGDILPSYLTAFLHSNNKDWWIIQPKNKSNTYYKILIDSTGFSKIDSQSIGFSFDDRFAASAGKARFSPNGELYAYFNLTDGLSLYDFNRETGELSNFRHLSFRDTLTNEFAGLEFSPNSQFLYLFSPDSLWQLDLKKQELNMGRILIDIWNGAQDPFNTTFFDALLAPDCRIYVRPPTSTFSMHVINHPNLKGKSCDFEQQAIPIPTYLDNGTFPNFPRFRVDDDMVCDSTITSIFGEPIFIRKELLIYPNPATEFVTIQMPENRHGKILMYDSMLRGVYFTKEVLGTNEIELDISQYQSGHYYIEFIPQDRSSRIVYGSKLVIAH